jgi:type IV pilus assembly protein PilO
MASFSEMSPRAQILLLLGFAAAIVFAAEYAWLDSYRQNNEQMQTKLDQLRANNERLRPYERRLELLRAENRTLERQLQTLLTSVPEQKATDDFIREMEQSARESSVHIRRITAKAVVHKEFYIETPYELLLDGSYSGLSTFYDRLAHLQRIVNVNDLQLTALNREGGAPVSGAGGYRYHPSETASAICTVTTFFSQSSSGPLADAKKE